MLNPLAEITRCEAAMQGRVPTAPGQTLLSVVTAMWAAQERLTPAQAGRLARRDAMQLNMHRAATKAPGARPRVIELPLETL